MRYPACYRCHCKLRSGDWAWEVGVSAIHVALDGTVTHFHAKHLFCDDCGREA